MARQGRLNDFYALAPRLASRRGRGAPITCAAFDLLWVDGDPLIDRSYDERRKHLVSLGIDTSDSTVIPSWPGEDAADLLSACDQLGVEGVVLKKTGARYRPGARSYDWRKVKCAAWSDHLERRRPR